MSLSLNLIFVFLRYFNCLSTNPTLQANKVSRMLSQQVDAASPTSLNLITKTKVLKMARGILPIYALIDNQNDLSV